MINKQKLIREQLETTLKQFSTLSTVNSPPKGWIRAIRDALGMTAKQLARRMHITQQSVARIEKDEPTGAVTIKTMRRTAEALDCIFVYGFVPKTSLDATVRTKAKEVATKRLAQVSQTMALEAQSLSEKENKAVLSEMVEDLVNHPPSNLWDQL
jgi:predicted DNA-binding mobile mystery protein A